MARRGDWTDERRARQSTLIQRWKPWRRSTGPKSADGKARASANALKHGGRSTSIARLRSVLRLIEAFENEKNKEKQ